MPVTRKASGDVFTVADLLYVAGVEPDLPRLMMVWLTSLECHSRVDELDQTVVRMKDYIA